MNLYIADKKKSKMTSHFFLKTQTIFNYTKMFLKNVGKKKEKTKKLTFFALSTTFRDISVSVCWGQSSPGEPKV